MEKKILDYAIEKNYKLEIVTGGLQQLGSTDIDPNQPWKVKFFSKILVAAKNRFKKTGKVI